MKKKYNIKSFVINLSIIVVSILIFLLVMEFIFYLLSIGQEVKIEESVYKKSTSLDLIYELKPNIDRVTNTGVYFRTNDIGIREELNSSELKSPNKIIIIFLGDSLILGAYLNQSALLVDIFEKELKKSGYDYEVLNFGVDGYSTKQEIESLKKNGLQYNPKFVFLNYVLNDPIPSPAPMEYFVEEKTCHLVYGNLEVPCFLKKSFKKIRVFNFLYYNSVNKNAGIKSDDYWTELHNSTKYDNVKNAFLELKELSKAYGFEVYLIIYPTLDFDNNSYDKEWILNKVSEDGKDNGFKVINLYESLRNYPTGDLRKNTDDIVHLNPKGNKIVAGKIFEDFISDTNAKK